MFFLYIFVFGFNFYNSNSFVYFRTYHNLCLFSYMFLSFKIILTSVKWSGPHASSRTHEWRKALISSVRAWLGQALTIEDAVVSRSAFPITELLLFLYCPNFFFFRELCVHA
jgi:hypothetical protein